MTNEVFGTGRAILIITDTSLGAFWDQLGVLLCTFVRWWWGGSDKERMKSRELGVIWHLLGICLPHMLSDRWVCLDFHKIKNSTSLIWQRRTSRPHKPHWTPLSDTYALLLASELVQQCAYSILTGIFHSYGFTQSNVEMNPVPLPDFSWVRDTVASHTPLGSCSCVCTGWACLVTADSHTQLRERYRTLDTLARPCVVCEDA